MAMNGTVLGNTIGQTLYDAIPADIKEQMSAAQQAETLSNLKAAWQKIAADIVDHITSSAVVDVTVASGIGVQVTPSTGTGATSTTGSGTGTIS